MAFFRSNDGKIYYTIFIARAKLPQATVVNELRPWSGRTFLSMYRLGIQVWIVIFCFFVLGLAFHIPFLTGDPGVFVLCGIDILQVVATSAITKNGFRGLRKDISAAQIDASLSKAFYLFYLLTMLGSAILLMPVLFSAGAQRQVFAVYTFSCLIGLLLAAAAFYGARFITMTRLGNRRELGDSTNVPR